jgi:hypothetical protein
VPKPQRGAYFQHQNVQLSSFYKTGGAKTLARSLFSTSKHVTVIILQDWRCQDLSAELIFNIKTTVIILHDWECQNLSAELIFNIKTTVIILTRLGMPRRYRGAYFQHQNVQLSSLGWWSQLSAEHIFKTQMCKCHDSYKTGNAKT